MTAAAQPAAERVDAACAPVPAAMGRAAILALYDELALAPKPGLVSFVDAGSHDDMDARTFMRSLFALRSAFVQMAQLGASAAPFAALERCGIAAEGRMLAATGGVNTHRGAIFTLGLLCASAAAAHADGQRGDHHAIRAALLRHWGEALTQRAQRPSRLPGGRAAQRYGMRSASQEAALGLPTLFETAVPAWQNARAQGLAGERLRLQVFFTLLAQMGDCNLAHRGGLEGLHFAREQAAGFLAAGGAAAADAHGRAWAIHRRFVARRLSPGGCADMLAATCLLERIGALG